MVLYNSLSPHLKRKIPQWAKWGYAWASLILRKAKVKMYFWVDGFEMNSWFESKNIFFILSIGRSGTKFLADLLNKAPGALVVHEPFIEAIPHQIAYHDSQKAEEYITKFRKKEIYLRVHKLNINTYGEVNSWLRRHCHALKKAFPKAKFLHLVRDPRAVVRSMYSRETMLPKAYDSRWIYPKEGDPWKDQWQHMTRFEKLCWYWTIENRYLRECIGREAIQFEKVISDYEYFREKVLEPLGLEIPRDTWEKEVKRPKNVSVEYRLPHWSKWTKDMKESFEKICGEEMEKYGYKLGWQ